MISCGLLFHLVILQAQTTQAQTQAPQSASPPGSATTPQAGVTTLEPVVVTATRSETPLADVPAAVSVVDQSDIQLGQPTVGLDESLNRVPGVFIQNAFNFSQDQRISIRGFGTRAAFGVREIKLVVDGIIETSPDDRARQIISTLVRSSVLKCYADQPHLCTAMPLVAW